MNAVSETSLHRIKSMQDDWYNRFYDIYHVSFPVFEQRSEEQQRYAFSQPNYHLECTLKGDTLSAFIAYWEFNNYIYIEHLAVNPRSRGANIGSTVLQDFISQKSKTILLEIDPLTTDIAHKRFRFYERLGFVSNPYPHHHPPYDEAFPAHELIVLSHGRGITPAEYQTFYNDLAKAVMQKDTPA